jgi:hypothetical protein
MRRIVMGLVTVGALGLALSVARADRADGKLELHEGSVGAGIGVSWGSGTLSFAGKEYPVQVEGLSVGDVGATRVEAAGVVHNLNKLSDFDGNYTAIRADLTAGGGGGVISMRNQNGVQVELFSTTQGAKVALGPSGVNMKIK